MWVKLILAAGLVGAVTFAVTADTRTFFANQLTDPAIKYPPLPILKR